MPRKKSPAKVKPKKRVVYRSGFEHKLAEYLRSRDVPFAFETLKLAYTVPSSKHIYTPDFILPNGVIIEVKGKLDRDTRKKMALVREQHPDLDIRFLLMRDNKISKTSKTRYSDWLTKHGYDYHVSLEGHIPEEWYRDV